MLPQSRFLYLDSIRALAAIYVLLHHASLQYYKYSEAKLSGLETYVLKIFSYGHLSVDVFIVLSGFSLMLAVIKNQYQLKGGTLLFFKRRIQRIIPPYYATLGICLLFIWLFMGNKTGGHWDEVLPVTVTDIVTHLFMIHDFFGSSVSQINYSLWSISVEFRIYLLFPILVWIWRKAGAYAVLFFSVLFTVGGTILLTSLKSHYSDIGLNSSGVCPYIILFTLGMITAELSFSESKRSNTIRASYKSTPTKRVVILLFIYVVAYVSASELLKTGSGLNLRVNFINQEVKDISIGIFAAFFLFICATSTQSNTEASGLIKWLNWQPLVFVGTFSYSLYLIHPLLIQLVSQYTLTPLHLSLFISTVLLLLLGTPVILFFSYLFFYVFERPFLTAGKHKSIIDLEVASAKNPAI